MGSQVWTDRPHAAEYVTRVLHPSLAKKLYEVSSEGLMDQAAKSVIWYIAFGTSRLGLYFIDTLIDHVHDAGQIVRLLTEWNSVLRAENRELKSGVGSEVVVATERQATELNADVEQLKAALCDSEQRCKDHQLATDSARDELKDLRESRGRLEDEVLLLTRDAKVLRSKIKTWATRPSRTTKALEVSSPG
ncbi:hypothetical protein GW17_00036021 [Ensete ventricosum]|nr:hypothetical protein GW17_00036021 [Ensete ventricosum]